LLEQDINIKMNIGFINFHNIASWGKNKRGNMSKARKNKILSLVIVIQCIVLTRIFQGSIDSLDIIIFSAFGVIIYFLLAYEKIT